MAIIKSGASSDQLTIDATSKASRNTLYDTTGRSVAFQSKPTFYASGTFTPAATPTDLVTIYGSASKTVRLISFKITTTNTAAGSQQFLLLRRSAVNTTGTFVAANLVPADTTDTATATVGHYTANPGGLGTSVGTLNIMRAASPAAIPASFAGVVTNAGFDMLPDAPQAILNKMITLNANTQGIVLNFASAALVAGQTHAYQVIWTEE